MTAIDMTRFIEAKSDQLNADDLISGPRTITIRKVAASDSEQPINVFYEGDDNKPFRPCKTIRRVMVACWGADAGQYVGRSMTLYRDSDVLFGGMKVGGIRVSHMSHIAEAMTVVVMKTKGKKAPMKVLPLRNSPAVASPPATAAEHPSIDAGQLAGAASTGARQTPAEWVQSFTERLNQAQDRDAVIAMQTKAEKALAKLGDTEPTLYALAIEAIKARAASFDDGGDADEPGDWRGNVLAAG